MKRLILIAAFVSLPLVAFAYNSSDVRYTVHNMAYNTDNTKGLVQGDRNFQASNSKDTQVCIFCHTPHNAGSTNQLWNHVNPTGLTYKMYSSGTLHAATRGASLGPNSPSLLCLGCHDGVTAINVLHQGGTIDMKDMSAGAFRLGDLGAFGSPASNLGATYDSNHTMTDSLSGTNLRDDHPIGFSYATVAGDKPLSLHSTTEAEASGIRFFGSGKSMECSSCHDPHVFYGYYKTAAGRERLDVKYPGGDVTPFLDRTPFLVRSNTGSALCLACHKK